MHEIDDLTRFLDVFQRTLAFVKAEVQRDPLFAQRLVDALGGVSPLPPAGGQRQPLPDLFTELGQRSEADFCDWLQTQPIEILRALIRTYGLDPAKKTVGWRDPARLAELITKRALQRLQQGQVFVEQERDPEA